jgi:RNA polymerase sigma factor (sigma-70 family)
MNAKLKSITGMKTSKSKILCIGEPVNKCKQIHDALTNAANELILASTVDLAIKELMKQPIDLIICTYEIEETNAFQVYRIINNEITKHAIPFIVVLKDFDINKILIGAELGVDSFIFNTYNEEQINNMVELQIQKNKERKNPMKIKYETVCNLIPFGLFLTENSKIVEANKIFYNLINSTPNTTKEYTIKDLLIFRDKNKDELKLLRLNNGLENNCTFKNVKIAGRNDELFEVSFSFIKAEGSINRIMGIIIPNDNTIDIENLNLHKSDIHRQHKNKELLSHIDLPKITLREQEILKLSARGMPVKQIAQHLNISQRTVEKHRSNIISKTKTENIVEAVFVYSKYISYQEALQ